MTTMIMTENNQGVNIKESDAAQVATDSKVYHDHMDIKLKKIKKKKKKAIFMIAMTLLFCNYNCP